MSKKIVYCVFILVLLLMATCLPNVSAVEDDQKDTDLDGIPDYLDNEKVNSTFNTSKSSQRSQPKSAGSFSEGSWSFSYGSDTTYGAYIGDVRWNLLYYIYTASVPWVKIDSVQYEIPNDFTTEEVGSSVHNDYYLAYQLYSIEISGLTHDLEVLWKFWKNADNGAGKITARVLLSANDINLHTLATAFRVDFDILGCFDDRIYGYGSSGWCGQNTEAYQFTYNPVDPVWGMKVKQVDQPHPSAWGGIKAWTTNEMNYCLRCHDNERKGDPMTYVTSENTYRENDLIWTSASTAGKYPIQCGPTIFVY